MGNALASMWSAFVIGGDLPCKDACRIRMSGDWHCKKQMACLESNTDGDLTPRSTARRASPRVDDAGPGLPVGDCRCKDAVDAVTGGDGPCKLPVVPAGTR